jgi:AbiV family abortive infection protein
MNNLEISAIDKGMVLCCNQATQLIIDGDLLLEHKRYPTAFSLYQLASEESSKIKILVRLALEKRSGITLMDDERGKYFKKLFHNHLEKIKLAATTDKNFNELAVKINFPKFRNQVEIQDEIENPKLLDLMKQDGLYVGLRDNKFIPPSEIIGEGECKKLRDDVVFRHSRHKETMEHYIQHTDFLVKQFVDAIMKQENLKENNN